MSSDFGIRPTPLFPVEPQGEGSLPARLSSDTAGEETPKDVSMLASDVDRVAADIARRDSGIGSREGTPPPQTATPKKMKTPEGFYGVGHEISMEWEGQVLKGRVNKIEKGATGIVHLMQIVSEGPFYEQGMALKMINRKLTPEKAARATEELKGSQEDLLELLGDRERVLGLPDKPHLVSVLVPAGESQVGQLQKLTDGDISDIPNSFNVQDMDDKDKGEHREWMNRIFVQVLGGHLRMIEHGQLHTDNSFQNIHTLDQGAVCHLADIRGFPMEPKGALPSFNCNTEFVPFDEVHDVLRRIGEYNESRDPKLLRHIVSSITHLIVFSTGSMLYEVMEGMQPYEVLYDDSLPLDDPRRYPTIDRENPPPPSFDPFINRMIDPDPNQRPTLQEAFIHFFKTVDEKTKDSVYQRADPLIQTLITSATSYSPPILP